MAGARRTIRPGPGSGPNQWLICLCDHARSEGTLEHVSHFTRSTHELDQWRAVLDFCDADRTGRLRLRHQETRGRRCRQRRARSPRCRPRLPEPRLAQLTIEGRSVGEAVRSRRLERAIALHEPIDRRSVEEDPRKERLAERCPVGRQSCASGPPSGRTQAWTPSRNNHFRPVELREIGRLSNCLTSISRALWTMFRSSRDS